MPRWAGALAIYAGARLPGRRRAHARRPGRRRADGDAGRARPPPLRAAADRAARVGEPHPAADRLVSAVRRRTQRRRPRSTSSRSSTPAAPWGGTCSRSSAVLLLGFYWTLEGERRMRALVLFAPFDRRRAIRGFITEIERTVGAYLRGQSLVCLVIGLLAFVIYRLHRAAARGHRRRRLRDRRGDPGGGPDHRHRRGGAWSRPRSGRRWCWASSWRRCSCSCSRTTC